MEHVEPAEEALKKPKEVGDTANAGSEEKPEGNRGDNAEEVVNPDTQEQDMDIEGEHRIFEANKRVKVYFLEETSWEDRGTGFIEGIYDQQQDEAILLVVEEDESAEQAGSDSALAPGGFLREPENPTYLLRSRVSKGGQYSRQQDTLIVWTEPDGTEIALSFQDPAACANICEFIGEVQQHLQLVSEEHAKTSSSSPAPASPQAAAPETVQSGYVERDSSGWAPLELSNLSEQSESLRASTRSIAGREKTVEFVLSNDYVRQMIKVFGAAEDLESISDLHTLCNMMTIILTLNDNGLYEYLLQEDIFVGVAGIMEYDPEYPKYKATYRDFLTETNRFKEVIPISDPTILAKVHQTYRLHYLKDVILARVLDDPTFNILNSLLFFNQIDIIAHIGNNDSFLRSLFEGFKEQKLEKKLPPNMPLKNIPTSALNPRTRDIVAFLHQLMLMGKQVQAQHRLALYKILLERGLLYVCELALQRPETTVINQGAEMISLILDHDLNGIRSHCMREHEAKRRTVADDICALLVESKDLGLKSQMSDAIRALVDVGLDPTDPPTLRAQKGGAVADAFVAYFYDAIASSMYRPLVNLPDVKSFKAKPIHLDSIDAALIQLLTELMATAIPQHGHRIQYFILSNPIVSRVASLAYMKQKSLKHAAIRFFKACVLSNNHFLHRHLTKNELLLPLIDMLETEGPRDNMLCSSCMYVFELIRRDNIKALINHLFEKYDAKLQRLSSMPNLRGVINALRTRWEQNNEPPPSEPMATSEEISGTKINEDDYFNETDDDTPGPQPPKSPEQSGIGQKRKRPKVETKPRKIPASSSSGSIRSLSLDYSDESDSDAERPEKDPPERSGSVSPSLHGALEPSAIPANEAASPVSTASPTQPRLKLKLSRSPAPVGDSDLGEMAAKMAKKRLRQEEEEEEGGLANLMSGGRPGTPRAAKTEDPSAKERFAGIGTAVKDAGKKIKLNFGFGKKGESKGETSEPKKG